MASDDKIEIEIALKNAKEAVKTLESITKKAEELPKKTESAFKSVGTSISSGFQSIQKNFLLATAAITAGLASIKGAIDVTKEAAKFRQSTDAMFSQFGVNANEVISALKKVSDGTISNADLVSAANKTMALNVTRDVDKMAKLLEVARVRARAMGIDTTQAFNDIATGIGRNSPLILDNLGIVTKGWDAEAKSAGVAYDTQFILNKVLQDGNKILEKTGPLTLSASERFDKLDSTFKNLKIQIGTSLLPLFEKLAKEMQNVADFGKADTSEKDTFTSKMASKSIEELQKLDKEYSNLYNQYQNDLDIKKEQLEIEKKKGIFFNKSKEIEKEILDIEKARNMVSDDQAVIYQQIQKKTKEVSDNIAQSKANESAKLLLTEEEKEKIESIAMSMEDQYELEIKTLEALKKRAKNAGDIEAVKTLEAKINELIYKQMVEFSEVDKTNVKTAKEKNIEASQFVGILKSQNSEAMALVNSLAEVGDAISKTKTGQEGVVKSSGDWVTMIIKLVSALGELAETSKNKTVNTIGQIIKFTQDLTVVLKTLFPVIGTITDAVKGAEKAWVNLIPVVGPLIAKFRDNNKEIASDIKKTWTNMYDDIVKEAEKAAFEQERIDAQKARDAVIQGSEAYKTLQALDQEDAQKKRDDLVAEITAESDADKKKALQKQLLRIDSEKALADITAKADEDLKIKLADIKKREFEFEKESRIAMIKASRSEAYAEAAKIVGKSKRAEAKADIKENYDKILAEIKALTPPAYAQGGSFITSGPQTIRVGDNNGGRERVTVEPLNGSGSSGSGITLNNVTIQANDPQQFFNALNNYQRQYGVI